MHGGKRRTGLQPASADAGYGLAQRAIRMTGLATGWCAAGTAIDAHKPGFAVCAIDPATSAIDRAGSPPLARKPVLGTGLRWVQSGATDAA